MGGAGGSRQRAGDILEYEVKIGDSIAGGGVGRSWTGL